MKEDKKGNGGNGIGLGAAIGVAIAVAVDPQSDNLLPHIAWGLSIGVVLGAVVDFLNRPK
jgi:hypothetical protein